MAAWLVVSWLLSSVAADCSTYRSNGELFEYLSKTAQLEPSLANFYLIGVTYQGWDIPVLELSAAEPSEQLPSIKFVGGVHGDEPIGTEILMSFIEHLLDGHRREEPFIQWLLNNTRIHILPRLNLEGFELAEEGVCNLGPGRENSAGYDLNRAFPPKKDIPEAEAIVEWLENKSFVLSATVNAGERVVVYPPDDLASYGGRSSTLDDDVFQHLASAYAKNHKNMAKENGCNGNSHFKNGTVSGAAWYPIKGSMQDYNYLMASTLELTLEISCCKYPPSDQICGIWEENKLALQMFAAESCRGVRGLVTALGVAVVGASVSILGRNMTVRTNDQGYYFRILLPGRYFIKVESEGLKTFIKEFFVPHSETAFLNWAVLDIQLEVERTPAPTNNANNKYYNYSTEPPSEQTVGYDRGGLDPDRIPTYDDSYLSTPNDSEIRLGLVQGTGATGVNNCCLIFICSLLILTQLVT